MKKLALLAILFLILTTSLVKNSTKKIEDKIFETNENINTLKVKLSDIMLEYNYLSSPKKLIQYQSKYFEYDLTEIDIMKIKTIKINRNDLEIKSLTKKGYSDE